MSSHSEEIDRACKPKPERPNPKSVKDILWLAYSDPEGLCAPLSAKLREHNRYVVLKALIILHLVIETGPVDYANPISYIAKDLKILPPEEQQLGGTSASRASPDRGQRLVSKYTAYLENRLAAYRELNQDIVNVESDTRTRLAGTLGREVEIASDITQSGGGEASKENQVKRFRTIMKSRTLEQDLLKVLVMLQKQMGKLFDCIKEMNVTDGADIDGMMLNLWLKDLVVLINAYYRGLINATNRYSQMSDAEAETTVELRIDFDKKAKQVNAYVESFKVRKSCFKADLRKISRPDNMILPELPNRRVGPSGKSNLGPGRAWKKNDPSSYVKPLSQELQSQSYPGYPDIEILSGSLERAEETFLGAWHSGSFPHQQTFSDPALNPYNPYRYQAPPKIATSSTYDPRYKYSTDAGMFEAVNPKEDAFDEQAWRDPSTCFEDAFKAPIKDSKIHDPFANSDSGAARCESNRFVDPFGFRPIKETQPYSPFVDPFGFGPLKEIQTCSPSVSSDSGTSRLESNPFVEAFGSIEETKSFAPSTISDGETARLGSNLFDEAFDIMGPIKETKSYAPSAISDGETARLDSNQFDDPFGFGLIEDTKPYVPFASSDIEATRLKSKPLSFDEAFGLVPIKDKISYVSFTSNNGGIAERKNGEEYNSADLSWFPMVLSEPKPPCLKVVDEEVFVFLNTDICFQPNDVGLTETDQFHAFPSYETIILGMRSTTMLYKPTLKKLRQLRHSQKIVNPDATSSATLSPDGKNLVQRLNSGDLIQAIDVDTKQIIDTPASLLMCGQLDLLNSVWKSHSSLLIPCFKKGHVALWNLREKNVFTKQFQPLSAIMRHQVLEFCCSIDNKWWIAIGRSLIQDKWNGTIEIYDTKNEESRVVNGATCCIAEVEVYDETAPLLVMVDTKEGNKLSLSVTQIDVEPEKQKFIPVNVSVRYFVAEDSPVRVTVFDGLPIVVVTTHKKSLYFFELHTGASLHSRHYLDCILPTSIDGRSIINQRPDRTLERISINESDLIGWVRRVLKDDTLASSIAIRTGLPGADDVLFDAMHGVDCGVKSAEAT